MRILRESSFAFSLWEKLASQYSIVYYVVRKPVHASYTFFQSFLPKKCKRLLSLRHQIR